MHRIDARGMSCPQPVLMTKKACESGEKNLTILVDNPAALGNVTRFLNSAGFSSVSSSEEDGEYVIEAKK